MCLLHPDKLRLLKSLNKLILVYKPNASQTNYTTGCPMFYIKVNSYLLLSAWLLFVDIMYCLDEPGADQNDVFSVCKPTHLRCPPSIMLVEITSAGHSR